MKILSLFSGLGAFEKALFNLGIKFKVVGFSEIDKYAIESYCLIHNVNEGLNFGDIRKINEKELPNFDLMTYGFPCQDISVAGKQKGIIAGQTRSGLLYDALRIAKEKKPKYMIAENVKNLVGKKFKGEFENLLKELDEMGYNNYWQVLNAKHYGIPQNRERVFIVSIRKDIDVNKFVFPKPFDNGLRLRDLLEEQIDEKYFLSDAAIQRMIRGNNPTIKEEIRDYSKTLCASHFKDGISNQYIKLKLTTNYLQWDYGNNYNSQQNRAYYIDKVMGTVPADNNGNKTKILLHNGTKKGYTEATEEDGINLAFPRSKTRRGRVIKENSPTLDTSCNVGILNNFKIRRLTPKECFRLMGFEDKDVDILIANGISNTQLYKLAGNSIVVNVLEEILKKLFDIDK